MRLPLTLTLLCASCVAAATACGDETGALTSSPPPSPSSSPEDVTPGSDASSSGDASTSIDGAKADAPGDGSQGDGALPSSIPAGPWAGINLAATPAYSVSLAARDYPVWVPNPSHHVYRPTGGWDGGPSARIFPPNVDQTACGLGGWDNLWRNGTLAIRKLNVRFELLLGPSLAQNWSGSDWKFFIAHTSPTLIATPDPGGGERPMANFGYHSNGVLGWAVGAGTVKNFNRSPPNPPAYFPTNNADFFMGSANGTLNGRPIVGPNTWVSVEIEIIAESTTEAPNGRIRSVLTKRDGTVLTDLAIPWTYDSNWTLGDYIATVQLIGGYWNTGTNAAAADNYYEIADRITFAANRPGLLGPREGFVQ